MNHGKALKNKFGEALYKNELMFEKVMNKRMDKVNEEISRSSQIFDSASLVFLNRVRAKRTKWIQDDIRYRDYYKMVCNNVHKKKLNTLGQSVDPDYLPYLNDEIQYKFVLLDQHLKTKKVSSVQFPNIIIPKPRLPKEVSFFQSEVIEEEKNDANSENFFENSDENIISGGFFDDDIVYNDVIDYTNQFNNNYINNLNEVKIPIHSSKTSNIPNLPKIKSAIYNIVNARSIEEDFDLLYSKFSDCDTEFLDKLPGKVEIQDTNIGKRFISDKKQKGISFKNQKKKFTKIQSNALVDTRFKNLINYLQN